MKKIAALLAVVLAITAFAAISVSAVEKTDFGKTALVDDFNRTDADKDLAGKTNSEGLSVWWSNWDAGTQISDNALRIAGADAHWAEGVATGDTADIEPWDYLVLRVKGDATGVALSPGGAAYRTDVANMTAKGGSKLPALTADWQEWVIDMNASGLHQDQGFHINIVSGTLYVDYIYYASEKPAEEAPAVEAAPAAEEVAPAAEEEAPVEFPPTALVDDFNRPADELDNSGGVNSEGLDTWWYNAYDFVIENGMAVITFDADHEHFGMGANVPTEAEYNYLVIEGYGTGDLSGLMLNLGAKNPVLFSEMKHDGESIFGGHGFFPTALSTIVIDLDESGIIFDQGFHINCDTVGTLYLDKIYYSKDDVTSVLNYAQVAAVAVETAVEPEPEDTAVETPVLISAEAPAEVKDNPKTEGNNALPMAAVVILLAGIAAFGALKTKKAR